MNNNIGMSVGIVMGLLGGNYLAEKYNSKEKSTSNISYKPKKYGIPMHGQLVEIDSKEEADRLIDMHNAHFRYMCKMAEATCVYESGTGKQIIDEDLVDEAFKELNTTP